MPGTPVSWFALALTAALMSTLAPARADTPGGELTASVDMTHGMPRLMLNGQPTPPLIFFFNTDVPGDRRQGYLEQQVRLSAAAGIHLYSLPLRVPRQADGATPNYAYAESLLDRFIAADPQAMFFVRIYPGLDAGWALWKALPEGEIGTFADGSHGLVSLASAYFQRTCAEDLTGMVRHFEASPYAKRIIVYHPGGPNHENFHDAYREKGPDYSAANQRAFRHWLRARYQTDAALRAAWARPEISLDTAGIPTFEPGRFPMHGAVSPTLVFYDLPREQGWVDFSDFSSDIFADSIIAWAQIVKRESRGRKLSATFYGYTMELPGSFSGQYALRRVLDCPAVDILAAPCSYVDRAPGGTGGNMSLIDTIAAHGKLWFNEDDTRTCAVVPADVPGWAGAGPLLGPIADNVPQNLGVLDRNLASVFVHRAGTWWMDLFAANAFGDPGFWPLMQRCKALYEQAYQASVPYRPQVALIVDERSKLYVKSDWDANAWTMYALREEGAKTGAAVGYYSMDDFISGLVPKCLVYVFGNAFCVSDRQMAAIRARLDREKATAVWVYTPGYFGNAAAGAGGVAALTGISVAAGPGVQGSEGVGLLAGEQWGVGWPVVPRLHIVDTRAKTLGHYRSDGLVSAAETHTGAHRSILLADIRPSAGVLQRIFASAGVHLWTRGGEIVQTDGSVLTIHAPQAGAVRISLPVGVGLAALYGVPVRREGADALADFTAGETRWFRLIASRGNVGH